MAEEVVQIGLELLSMSVPEQVSLHDKSKDNVAEAQSCTSFPSSLLIDQLKALSADKKEHLCRSVLMTIFNLGTTTQFTTQEQMEIGDCLSDCAEYIIHHLFYFGYSCTPDYGLLLFKYRSALQFIMDIYYLFPTGLKGHTLENVWKDLLRNSDIIEVFDDSIEYFKRDDIQALIYDDFSDEDLLRPENIPEHHVWWFLTLSKDNVAEAQSCTSFPSSLLIDQLKALSADKKEHLCRSVLMTIFNLGTTTQFTTQEQMEIGDCLSDCAEYIIHHLFYFGYSCTPDYGLLLFKYRSALQFIMDIYYLFPTGLKGHTLENVWKDLLRNSDIIEVFDDSIEYFKRDDIQALIYDDFSDEDLLRPENIPEHHVWWF